MGCWAVCRYTKRAGDALINTSLGITEIWSIFWVLTAADLPYQPVFIGLGLISIVMNTNLKNFHLFLAATGYLLLAWEDSFVAKEVSPPLLLPGAIRDTDLQGRIIRQATSILTGVACAALMAAMVTEHNRHSKGMEAALEMAQAVANKLVAYDTAGAQGVLDDAAEAGIVTTEFLLSFKRIASNLEKYRAFIPQALLSEDLNHDLVDVAVEEEEEVEAHRSVLEAPGEERLAAPISSFNMGLHYRKVTIMRVVFLTES